MPFGKYVHAVDKMITNMYGNPVPLKTPAGYAGLFRGTIYDAKGNRIPVADHYFMKLAQEHGKEQFAYWDRISNRIEKDCKKYIVPLMNENPAYAYQCGFGGDESDGLIDFWLPMQSPGMPDIVFTIQGVKYTLKWTYIEEDDD